jgi:hypothetical protein
VRAGDEVRESIDDIQERYEDLVDHMKHLLFRLKQMAERGAVAVERRSDIYAEDIRLISKLTAGQELGSCAFVQDDPRQQLLDDQDFLSFLREQVQASLRRVRVKRVYVCESAEDARNVDFLTHLSKLQEAIVRQGDPEHFEVRVLVLESLGRAIRGEYRIDVLIFGNRRVSFGDLSDRTQTLLRAEYQSDEKSVREAKNKFLKVFNTARPLSEFLTELQAAS